MPEIYHGGGSASCPPLEEVARSDGGGCRERFETVVHLLLSQLEPALDVIGVVRAFRPAGLHLTPKT
jgi:hypothetical protein